MLSSRPVTVYEPAALVTVNAESTPTELRRAPPRLLYSCSDPITLISKVSFKFILLPTIDVINRNSPRPLLTAMFC